MAHRTVVEAIFFLTQRGVSDWLMGVMWATIFPLAEPERVEIFSSMSPHWRSEMAQVDGASLSTTKAEGTGNTGDIVVRTSDRVLISGVSPDGSTRSSISSLVGG